VYHVELRKFPNSACAFNLNEAELRAIAEPWSQDRWVELGERKWSPFDARLTVIEGPHLDVGDLAMGRGWGNAQRHGEDVTERVLARARAGWDAVEPAAGESGSAPAPGADAGFVPGAAGMGAGPGLGAGPGTGTKPGSGSAPADVAARLMGLLGEDPDALLAAWRLAAERRPELPPSEALALAEQTLSSLDRS
jgi:hypothetical protein